MRKTSSNLDICKHGEMLRETIRIKKWLEIHKEKPKIDGINKEISRLKNLLPGWAIELAYLTCNRTNNLPPCSWNNNEDIVCGFRFSMCLF